MKKAIVPVVGMHCASCAQVISRALRKVEGVGQVSAQYATEKVSIEYDPQQVSEETLQKTLKPFGYSLQFSPSSGSEQAHSAESGHDHMRGYDENTEKIAAYVSFSIAIFIFLLMIWDTAGMFFDIPSIPIPNGVMQGILLIISSIILWGFGQQFIQGVVRFFRYGKANMDTLVGLGTMAAYFYSSFIYVFSSIAKQIGLSDSSFFDVTIVVIGFVLYGKYLEKTSKKKTGEALQKLLGLQSKTATVKRGDDFVEIPVSDVAVGDIVMVKPSTKIPVDAKIIEGYSTIDESMITGESVPVDVETGKDVIGGTMNLTGVLQCRATRVGSDTVLAHIAAMVESAQNSKASIERFADTVSGIFVPIVLVIAVLTFVIWMVFGSLWLGNIPSYTMALSSFIGVLVIACPCALGLATPTAIITAVGRGARMGILIKDAESLEKLHAASVVVLDKTGTITKGQQEVTDIFPKEDGTQILRLISSLEQYAEHPIAKAIVAYAKGKKIQQSDVTKFSAHQGLGVEGEIDGVLYRAGNAQFMAPLRSKAMSVSKDEGQAINEGKTPIYLGTKTKIIGSIFLSDAIKDGVAESIKQLHALGLSVVLLSGDTEESARHVGKIVGVDKVIARVKPEEKARHIKELQKGRKTVVMVGDGVNDAPALATADIGVAMSTGTDIAMSTAQITLLHGDIRKLVSAFRLSKKTMRIVKQNLFWAFIYNCIGVPVAAGLLYPSFGVVLNPVIAGAVMAFSSISVVTNSLRLKSVRI
jgi:Cu+-exporting ATPase